jgi:hypothetical protein
VRQTLTGVFEVPRLGLPWLAILAGSGQPLARVGLEENKATQRVPSGDRSVVVVVSGRALGSALWSHETRGALARLWAEARLLAPSLPHDFVGAVLTRWETSDAGSAGWDPGELEERADPPGLPLALALAPHGGGTAEEAVAAGFAAAARILDKRG